MIDLWSQYGWMILVPIVGGFIGWVTNYIAVKMLFHPRVERRFLWFRVQGVFPKRQAVFAQRLGEIVSTELLSIQQITAHLGQLSSSPKLLTLFERRIEKTITEKLPEIFPMAAMFLSTSMVSTIKGHIMKEIQQIMGDATGVIKEELEQTIDIHAMVSDKVSNFSSDKLEEIIFAIMSRELRFVELVGGVLGFLIGVAQVGTVYLFQ